MSADRLGVLPDPELLGPINYPPAPKRETPAFLMCPKKRGPFMKVDPSNEVNPFLPCHHEFTVTGASEHVFEPAYEGRRYLVNTGTRAVYTRTGGRVVDFAKPEINALLLDRLCVTMGADPQWLEVIYPCIKIAVDDRLVPLGVSFLGSLFVLDVLTENMTWMRRRQFLDRHFDQLGIKERPEAGDIFLPPLFSIRMAPCLFAALALQNKEFHGRLYSGMISRPIGSYYIFQAQDAHREMYTREFFTINDLDGFHDFTT